MKKFTLSIEGMHCGGCVRRITGALKGKDGVDGADLSVELGKEGGTATGTFDEELMAAADLIAAVDALGFKARLA
jgi:copper chaperone